MRRRILAAMLSVTILAVVGFGVPLGFVVERFVEEEAAIGVERAAVLATRQVSSTFATDNDQVELPASADGTVFGLYDRSGELYAGVGPRPADAITMRALTSGVVNGEVNGQLIVAVPVAGDEHVVGVIRATLPTSASDARTTRLLLLIAALGAVVIVISGAIGWFLAGRLSRPVGRLRIAARRLGDGDFGSEVPASTIPELDEVASAMNATAGRLRELIGRERAFSSDASHQLRTPIAGMRAAIETELEFPRDDRTQVLDELLSDLGRLERTVAELLAIARAGDAATEVDMSEVVADLEATWCTRLARQDRILAVAPVRYVPAAMANSAMLRHALDVLIDNSFKHGTGTISVAVTATEEAVIVSVADQGPGFPVEAVAGVGTHDNVAAVAGLGLPLAQRLVDAMGGRLIMANRGTSPRVDIVLRRATPDTSALDR